MRVRLRDVAAVIRSKNSGPYELTFDITFSDLETFNLVTGSGVINKELITTLYGVDVSTVLSIIEFPAARAIKITIVRPCGSGDLGDRDIYGAQQHAPLMEVEIDIITSYSVETA